MSLGIFKKHVLIPSTEPPCYFLSLSSFLIFKNGLNFFNALTWKSKLKKTILLLAYHLLKIQTLLLGQKSFEQDKVSLLSTAIDLLNIDIKNSNIYLPSYGKSIVQVLGVSGQCLKIVKIALNEENSAELKEESDNLGFLNKLSFNAFEIPNVLNEGKLEGFSYAVHRCPAHYRPMEYFDYSANMINILAELFQRPTNVFEFVNETVYFDRIKRNIRKVNDEDKQDLFKKVMLLYHDESFRFRIPLGLVHGDFKPWNLLINNKTGKLFVVDWPMMTANGFPLWDAFSYTLYTFFVLHYDVAPEQALQIFRQHGAFYKDYCDRLEIDNSLIASLLPLYLVDVLSTGNMWSRWEKNEGRPARIAGSIFGFLKYIMESNQFIAKHI